MVGARNLIKQGGGGGGCFLTDEDRRGARRGEINSVCTFFFFFFVNWRPAPAHQFHSLSQGQSPVAQWAETTVAETKPGNRHFNGVKHLFIRVVQTTSGGGGVPREGLEVSESYCALTISDKLWKWSSVLGTELWQSLINFENDLQCLGHKPAEHANSFFILFLCLFLSLLPFKMYFFP